MKTQELRKILMMALRTTTIDYCKSKELSHIYIGKTIHTKWPVTIILLSRRHSAQRSNYSMHQTITVFINHSQIQMYKYRFPVVNKLTVWRLAFSCSSRFWARLSTLVQRSFSRFSCCRTEGSSGLAVCCNVFNVDFLLSNSSWNACYNKEKHSSTYEPS